MITIFGLMAAVDSRYGRTVCSPIRHIHAASLPVPLLIVHSMIIDTHTVTLVYWHVT
jgi:hypothetical protein